MDMNIWMRTENRTDTNIRMKRKKRITLMIQTIFII